MNMASSADKPRGMMIIGIIFLLWSLVGIGAFVSQWLMAADQLANLPAAQREMWVSMPTWAWAAYAIAVFAGTAGAIALLMKKRMAVALFALSLIAVLFQFTYPFIIADGINTLGATGLIFPIFIIIVAIVQLALARKWRAAGWLN
jgi:hypothetical protein